jgi:Fic family protein
MKLAMVELQDYIKRKVSEKKNLYNLIKYENINERQAEILKTLINYPDKSFNIKEVQNQFGVVYQTSRTDLLSLENMGYLESKTMGKKMLFYKSGDFENKINKLNIQIKSFS